MIRRPREPKATVKIDLEKAARDTEARAMKKAQQTPAAKAILDVKGSVERGNRMQKLEAKEEKLLNRTGTGYGSYRNK